MRQATEDALGPRRDFGRAEVLQRQIEPAGQRGMDHGDRRLPFLPAGDGDDLRLRMPQQDLDQFQGRVARGAEDGNACHGFASLRCSRGQFRRTHEVYGSFPRPPRG